MLNKVGYALIAAALAGSVSVAYRQIAENRRLRSELAARDRSEHKLAADRDAEARRTSEAIAAEAAAIDALRPRLTDEERRAAEAADSLARLRNAGVGGRELDDLRAQLRTRADAVGALQRELKELRTRKSELGTQGKQWESGARAAAAHDQQNLAEQVTARQAVIVDVRARIDDAKRASAGPERTQRLQALQNELRIGSAELKRLQEEKRLLGRAAADSRAAGNDGLRVRRETYEKSEAGLTARLADEKADYDRRKRDIDEISAGVKAGEADLRAHEKVDREAKARVAAVRAELAQHEARLKALRGSPARE